MGSLAVALLMLSLAAFNVSGEDSSPDSAELIIGTIRDLCHAVNALIGCIADQNCQQVIFGNGFWIGNPAHERSSQ